MSGPILGFHFGSPPGRYAESQDYHTYDIVNKPIEQTEPIEEVNIRSKIFVFVFLLGSITHLEF